MALAALVAGSRAGSPPVPFRAGSGSLKAHPLTRRLGSCLAARALAGRGGRVLIEAAAEDDPRRLLADLQALGLTRGAVAGRMVSGLLPAGSLAAAAGLPSLRLARPSSPRTAAGPVISQGDVALGADLARATAGVDGSGITVGVLSDSFGCVAGGWPGDAAAGELPASTTVLEEGPCPAGLDEGRAMAQVIHDLAPGAAIVFRSGARGQADLAAGYQDLVDAGARIIVDDVLYDTEPMFQDGVVAQAVDAVAAQGVVVLPAVGNNGRRAHAAPFRSSGVAVLYGGDAHDFDPGPAVDVHQLLDLPVDESFSLVLQWDEPFFSVSGPPGSASDLDVCLMNDPPTVIVACGEDLNEGGDPVEAFEFFNDGAFGTRYNLVIELFQGPPPGVLKYVLPGAGGLLEHAVPSGAIYGHAQASGSLGVGTAFYGDTPAFGVAPPLVAASSSRGGGAILLGADGQRLPAPQDRSSPWVVGVDGVNTTFFGDDIADPGGGSDRDKDPNFFGTSAGAAHVAGAAALLLERNGALRPQDVAAVLAATAADMDDPDTAGFDVGLDAATGHGLVRAAAAVAAVPPCGDGVVQLPEECDDGNQVDDDACGNDCRSHVCGDGIIHAGNGEICDDGNGLDTDFCRSDCTPNFCGDGRLTWFSADLLANGDFEAGSLAGWTGMQVGDGAFVAAAPGAPTPTGGFPTAANSLGGIAYALADQVGLGVRVLAQDFTVPATATVVELTFQMFVNDQSRLGPIIDPSGLDADGPPNQHARVDILAAGAPLLATGPEIVRNMYLGVDSGALPRPYTQHAFDLSHDLEPGAAYRLRFAEVDNQYFLHVGLDNVGLQASLLEECDDGNVQDGDGCSALCRLEGCPAPGEVMGLRFASDARTLFWDPTPGAATYDVLRVDLLPVGPGTCLANGQAASQIEVDASPVATGEILRFLVRGRNECGPGSYGQASGPPGERLSAACPWTTSAR